MNDLGALLKRLMELLMPEVRHYYRVVRKARVLKSYCEDGGYYADVQLCRNDNTDDPREPVLAKVELPVIWGGPERGIICLPTKDTMCDVEYYDGDQHYPRISNIRWHGNKAPAAEADELLICQGKDLATIRFLADGTIELKTPKPITVEADSIALIAPNGINLGEAEASGPVALAELVAGELDAIKGDIDALKQFCGTHVHPTGVGPSGPAAPPPLVLTWSPGDVAAELVSAT